MSFQTPITIKEAIHAIEKKIYLLPGIQREFIWKTDQITKLFDSLMRNFPVGSFLFWRVEKQKIKDFQFYEFLRNYHQRDQRHNAKANVIGYNEVIAILDGQQRLTSLFIGLKGTYTYKLPRKFKNNDAAYPERQLYLNLLSESSEEDLMYDFKFLTKAEAEEKDEKTYWFRVAEILDLKEEHEVNDYLLEKGIFAGEKNRSKFANKTLFRLHSVVHKDGTINYFLENDQRLDKVLHIFIRVNSAGTPLSYADLLLSIATAEWKDKDAKEEFNKFVDDINNIGNGFRFDRDFVLKSCLVFCGFKNIAFKVDNFNKEAMAIIEKNWEKIKNAIRRAVELVCAFGFDSKRLVANYVVIPIAYYLLKQELSENFIYASKYREDRKYIQKWVLLSIVNQVFGGHPDSVLRPIRKIIDGTNTGFPFDKILNEFRGTPKSLELDDEEIENFFFYRYGKEYTFSALSLLYPHLDYKNQFHMDHIFPKSQFTKRNLLKRGISEEEIDFYLDNYDCLANLQLLEGPENREKKDTDFEQWLIKSYKNDDERRDFMRRNYIPASIHLSFSNFREFISERKKLMTEKYKSILF
jgi:uncharacterized protein with ParB-like and HNH nuclease domain